MFRLENIIRKNLRDMRPYMSARDDYSGTAEVFLDANESPFPTACNRYPDPYQKTLKEKISKIKKIPISHIFTGNGSDEVLDLIYRVFCEPNRDEVIILPPTYGMYGVLAAINAIKVKEVTLKSDFQPDLPGILDQLGSATKLIFICSPNNPTGNSISEKAIATLCEAFHGIVVVDEAYSDFSSQRSVLFLLKKYDNLIVIQTLSKAWGLAGLRIGMAFASEAIVQLLHKIKPPYNISSENSRKAIRRMEQQTDYQKEVALILSERERLKKALETCQTVKKVYLSDANFLLIHFKNALAVFEYLKQRGIIVRDRSQQVLCEDCLRITVGTPEENNYVIKTLKEYIL